MSAREPWLGVASAAGLIVMLVGDVVGFVVAITPLAYGLAAVLARRRTP